VANFRETLIRVAREADTSRLDMLRLRLALRIPRIADAVEEECSACLRATGQMQSSSAAAIDWSALIEALKELLPVIIEFIKALLVLFP